MAWSGCDKNAIVIAFYHELFKAHPDQQDKFPFKGVALASLSGNAAFKSQVNKTVAYMDSVVAGTADPAGLAARHKQRHVGPAEFKIAKSIMHDVAKSHGCTTDFGDAIDHIIGAF